MRKVKVTVYKFEELAPKVQQRVLSRFRGDDSDGVSECISDTFRDDLERYPFMPGTKVYFSLSYSQGDGVAFDGYLSSTALIGTPYEHLIPAIDAIRVTHHGRYSHSNSMHVDITTSGASFKADDYAGIRQQLQEYVAGVSREFERRGYKILDNAISDESIIEAIDANDYEFYANGGIYSEQD